MKLRLITVLAACLLMPVFAGAQSNGSIPAEVYYLMPEFRQGMVFLSGQGPAQGKLNICALDNTLRFLDDKGKEMSAVYADNIIKVQIDTVTFLRNGGVFYRLYPVVIGSGIALRRDVEIQHRSKEGAFGLTDETASIREYGTIYADGVAYELNGKNSPYKVSERLFLYSDGKILSYTKKNLKKVFPAQKAAIDDYFASGHPLPEDLPSALSLLHSLIQP
ncbi:MAG: hypothetical protein J6W82_01645 [Bacteroidales bacterium]|nr:hypothetical protein [Bacteroidales bacterium]